MLIYSHARQRAGRRILLSAVQAVFVALMVLQFVGWPGSRTWAEEPEVGNDQRGDTKFAEARPWDPQRDFPPPIAEDKTVKIPPHDDRGVGVDDEAAKPPGCGPG